MDPTATPNAPAATPSTRLGGAVNPPAPDTGGTPAPQGTPEPQGTPTPQVSNTPPLLGDDLSLRPGWTAELGEAYAPYAKAGAKFENLGGLLKSYSHLESLRGVPNANAPDEQKEAFRTANKIPNTVEDYQKAIPLPELPNGQAIPPEILAKAAHAGLDQNLTPEQLGAMIGFQMELSQDALASNEAAKQAETDAAFEALESEWGRDKESNYSNAAAAGKMLGLNLDDPSIGDNPALVRALAQIHSKLDEDTLRSVQAAGPTNNGGSVGDRAKARDIATNPANPLYKAYNDPSDPGHQTAHQKYDQFAAAATGFKA